MPTHMLMHTHTHTHTYTHILTVVGLRGRADARDSGEASVDQQMRERWRCGSGPRCVSGKRCESGQRCESQRAAKRERTEICESSQYAAN